MEAFYHLLPDIWFLIIGFLLLYYVVADGYDLGIGIISLFACSDEERGLMMAAIQADWHDNQTWLILLGGMLFGAFPVFYGILLSALYIPVLIMLVGLMFRGVAFAFRAFSPTRKIWGFSFGIGSLITALAQGFALGGLFSGLEIVNNRSIGSVWTWLNLFAFTTTVGVISGYVMLGANFLILKTKGDLQARAFKYAQTASYFTIILSAVLYIWVAMRYSFVLEKWIRHPFELSIFPALAVVALLSFYYGIRKRREFFPLLANICFVVFGFIGISWGLYPYIIPNVVSSPVSISKTAAAPNTLFFMLVVMAVILPIILVYSGYKLWVFRGKTDPKNEYE